MQRTKVNWMFGPRRATAHYECTSDNSRHDNVQMFCILQHHRDEKKWYSLPLSICNLEMCVRATNKSEKKLLKYDEKIRKQTNLDIGEKKKMSQKYFIWICIKQHTSSLPVSRRPCPVCSTSYQTKSAVFDGMGSLHNRCHYFSWQLNRTISIATGK